MASDDISLWTRLLPIAEQFDVNGEISSIEELGHGNVNDTFCVSVVGGGERCFVLQRINTKVFAEPELVMQNIQICSDHVDSRLKAVGSDPSRRRWEVPRLLQARHSCHPWVRAEGGFWRAITFIDASETFDTIKDLCHAREIGYGLGMFHRLIHDLPVASLADTLKGFHITPTYLEQYLKALKTSRVRSCQDLDYGIQFVSERMHLVTVLEQAKASGTLQLRPIHGDPKINNVMLDCSTGHAIALIDLDTVKPGLIHYDIGDCVRSCCNRLGEDTLAWQSVHFDATLCEALLQGYGSVGRSFLTSADYDYLYEAIRLIAFELGLRFLSDHLAGNIYFKVQHPNQNLDRALVQFKLTESIEAQESNIRTMIEVMRSQ